MEAFLSILQAITAIQYGIYIAIGLIVFIVLSILTIFLVSILTKSPFSFGIGFFKLSFGSKYNSVNKAGLITSILEYQEDHIRNIIKIENGTLKRQLNFCEQKLSEFKYILVNNYLELLSDKLADNEDTKLHKDYKGYQVIVTILVRELIDKVFHNSFLENHFDEMDEFSWRNYLNDKVNYILNYKTDYLDAMYRSDMLVSREESYESEKRLIAPLKEVLTSVYSNAKELVLQSKIELKKERENAKLSIQEICKNAGFSLEEK